MANQSGLTKTCVSCGLEKPLSAFLQVSGPKGTSYGQYCAACRGSGASKLVTPDKHDDTTSSTGHRIDSKTKVSEDLDKQSRAEHTQEVNEEEAKKREEKKEELLEKKGDKARSEFRHRKEYIEAKENFLQFGKKAAPEVTPQARERETTQQENKQRQITEENVQKTKQAVESEASKVVNFSNMYLDTATGDVRRQSAEFLKVRTWLGGGAAMSTYERQNKTGKAAMGRKDPLVENIKENFTEGNKPGSRKK